MQRISAIVKRTSLIYDDNGVVIESKETIEYEYETVQVPTESVATSVVTPPEPPTVAPNNELPPTTLERIKTRKMKVKQAVTTPTPAPTVTPPEPTPVEPTPAPAVRVLNRRQIQAVVDQQQTVKGTSLAVSRLKALVAKSGCQVSSEVPIY